MTLHCAGCSTRAVFANTGHMHRKHWDWLLRGPNTGRSICPRCHDHHGTMRSLTYGPESPAGVPN